MSAQGGHETALQSAGNRRKYRKRVPEILLVPDVVLIHEYIDKSLHVLPLVQDTISESSELSIQLPQDFTDSGALDFHFSLPGGQRSQWCRNLNRNTAHFESPVIKGSS